MESKERLDLMVDIETLDTADTAIVLSVAAVPFDVSGNGEKRTEEGFYEHVSTVSNLFYGRTQSQDTIDWWKRQEPLTYAKMQEGQKNSSSFDMVFSRLHYYLSNLNTKYDLYLWSRGIDFDFRIIDSCFKALELDPNSAYRFNKKRDVRTFIDAAILLGMEYDKGKVTHDALEDCIKQINEVKESLKYLRNGL